MRKINTRRHYHLLKSLLDNNPDPGNKEYALHYEYLRYKKLLYIQRIFKYTNTLCRAYTLEAVFELLGHDKYEKFKDDFLQFINNSAEENDEYKDGLEELLEHVKNDFNTEDIISHEIYPVHIAESIKKLIAEEIETFQMPENAAIYHRLKHIKSLYKLSDSEVEFIELLFIIRNNEIMPIIFSDTQPYIHPLGSAPDALNAEDYVVIFSIMLNINIMEIKETFNASSNVRKFRLVDERSNLAEEITTYLIGVSNTPLEDKYFKKYSDKVLKPENFDRDEEINYISNLIKSKHKQGVKILFYGKPGTGKTELVRALGRYLRLDTYEVARVFDSEKESDFNENRMTTNTDLLNVLYRSIKVCDETIDSKKALMIVDEADAILNSKDEQSVSRYNNKAIINELLDNTSCNQIWIVNYSKDIDGSTKRRFNYCMEFNDITHNQRKSIWSSIIKKYKLEKCIDDSNINYLSENYMINPGVIDKAVFNLTCILKNRPKNADENILKNIETSLLSHQAIIYGITPDKVDVRKPNNMYYDLEGLNVKADLPETFGILRRFTDNTKVTGLHPSNMNILLWGPPGTGKTEFAKYIARVLNKKLIILGASDILGPLVGNSEKNIKYAFLDAEEQNAILFIDEIDSLLVSRESVQQNWESTLVNELLTNMENFSGIFIAATNLLKRIDIAALRRFGLKLEFDYLTPEGTLVFFNRILKPVLHKALSSSEENQVRNIKYLTPGDFKIVLQRNLYINPESITFDRLISQLKAEVITKTSILEKRSGFIL